MKLFKLVFFVVFIFSILSCSKVSTYSKRLSGETWIASSITVSGDEQTDLPSLIFSNCDIYDENCVAQWIIGDGEAEFIWQFSDKGKAFELSNQSSEINSLDDQTAIHQCYSLSGKYEVVEHKKDKMQFKSSITAAYGGLEVLITIEKQ